METLNTLGALQLAYNKLNKLSKLKLQMRLKRVPKSSIIFVGGMYTGVYVAQNFEIPKVDEPSKLLAELQAWLDENRKKD